MGNQSWELGNIKDVLWESAAVCLWMPQSTTVRRRRDWSSMPHATEPSNKITENGLWSQGESLLLVITEKLCFRGSGHETQIAMGWVRGNKTNADLFFQRVHLWTGGETDRRNLQTPSSAPSTLPSEPSWKVYCFFKMIQKFFLPHI